MEQRTCNLHSAINILFICLHYIHVLLLASMMSRMACFLNNPLAEVCSLRVPYNEFICGSSWWSVIVYGGSWWLINNYWMRLSMISRIIQTEVNVICRSRRLRWITLAEVWIILDIMRKPNPIIILLYTQNSHTKMQAKLWRKNVINLAKFCYFVHSFF